MYNQINNYHIKNHFRKATVLILAICLAVPTIISTFISIRSANQIFSLLNLFAQEADVSIRYTINTSSTVSYITSITSLVIALLPALFWLLIYFTSKSNNPNRAPETGFSLQFIMSVLGVIGSCFLLVVSLILFIPLFSDKLFNYNDDAKSIYLIAINIVFVAVIFTFIYSILKARFFSAVKKSLTSNQMIVAGAGYGVFSIINAIFSFIYSIVLIANSFIFDTIFKSSVAQVAIFKSYSTTIMLFGILGLVTTFCYILEGIIAIGYSKVAKSVPATPNYNPYNNNGYNQYDPSFNQSYDNTNYNNQYYNNPYNQQYQNNQGYVNQQPVEPTYNDNDYNDGFDTLNNQNNNQSNNDTLNN